MEVNAKWRGGMHFDADTPSHQTVSYDSGQKDTATHGPTPMEIFLQAIAVCSSMDIVSILKKKRKEPEEFDIRVRGERRDEHPRIYTKIDILYKLKKDGLTKKDADQAIKLSVEKYCSVLGMLNENVKISWEADVNG